MLGEIGDWDWVGSGVCCGRSYRILVVVRGGEIMKLRISGEDEPDNVVYVKLKLSTTSGRIRLIAVNKLGYMIPQGLLLTLTPRGTIVLPPKVSQELGFLLDSEGRISVEGR